MRRLNGVLFLVLIGGGGYVFLQNYRIEGLGNLRVRPRETANADGSESGKGLFGGFFGRGSTTTASADGAGRSASGSVRIATFNMNAFGEMKTQQPMLMEKLADICRRFDVVAMQEVRSPSPDVLPRLVKQVNAMGVQYDYVIGPRLGRGEREQYAFLFNTATIEVDRNQMYTLNDPDDLLARDPLVASFRTLGAQPADAFTFTLVTIRTDPDDLQRELTVLDDVIRLIRAHNPQEDDVILLGDFNVDDTRYGELVSNAGMTGVIRALPTNTEGTQQLDNILYVSHATREFTGRSGVFDFMREFNLTLEQAMALSDHMPVWADFHVVEGGVNGQVAAQPSNGQFN